MSEKEMISRLKEYFLSKNEVLMAFLFGSHAKERAHSGSDWDIAVYFKPKESAVEWEEDRQYPEEDVVWNDCMDILKTDSVDLAVLNRAPAALAEIAIKGVPLVIKDERFFWEFRLIVSREGEDYRSFAEDFFIISERSSSIGPIDKAILEKTIRFIEQEARSYDRFSSLSQRVYETDADERRNAERWVENIMNAVIDIAKILLASSKKAIPDTYREALRQAIWLLNLSDEHKDSFEQWAKLRNILAHEYLDIRWKRIEDFIKRSRPYVEALIGAAKKFMSTPS